MAEGESEGGNSLIDAILNKYGSMESGLHDMGDVKVYFSAPARKTPSNEDEPSSDPTLQLPNILVLNRCQIQHAGNGEKLAEFKSYEPSSDPTLQLPNILVLNRCQIQHAGDGEKLAELCNSVQELDLAENSFKCLSEIISIVDKLPSLEFLNLSSNPLHLAPPLATTPGALVPMETVQKLVLNNTNVQWDSVHTVLKAMPRLEELHLSMNNHSTVSPSPDPHANLKLLQFNDNQVENWGEVQKLSAMFPSLETLVLLGNPIKVLGEDARGFGSLRTLCISDTLVDAWDELEKLNGFPELSEIQMQGIPLMRRVGEEVEAEEGGKHRDRRVRQLVVARLGKLMRLNRTWVTEDEREEAERMFIRRFRDSEVKPGRYDELIARHGNIQELAQVNMKVRTKFDCKLVYEDQILDLKVNTKNTVAQLKKQIAAIIGGPPSRLRIFFKPTDPLHLNRNDELIYATRLLFNYQIADGDAFQVDK